MKAYQLKASIKGAKPPIWRRFIVPAGVTFSEFGDILDIVIGWNGALFSEFEFSPLKTRILKKDDLMFTPEYREGFEHDFLSALNHDYNYDAEDVIIDEFLNQVDWFTYIHDLETDWQHRVEIEKTLDDYELSYPKVLKYKGVCPEELFEDMEEDYDLESVNLELQYNFDVNEDYDFGDDLEEIFESENFDNQGDSAESKPFQLRKSFVEKPESGRKLVVSDCLAASMYLYGVVPLKVLTELFNKYIVELGGETASPLEVKKLADEVISVVRDIKYISGQYMLAELAENNEYKMLLKLQDNKKFYVPTYDEVIQIVQYGYLIDEPMIKRLNMFLINKLGVKHEKADALSGYTQSYICEGYDVQDILGFLEDNDVTFADRRQVNEIIALLGDMWNDTRMKFNRGYKPNELMKPNDKKKPGGNNIIYFDKHKV